MFYVKGRDKTRSCIIAKKEIKLTLISNLCDQDTTAVKWEGKTEDSRPVSGILASVYLPYDSKDNPTLGLQKLAKEAATTEVLIGCDANAHHKLWGSSDINSRGKSLLDFISTTNLTILNVGTTPTFVTKTRSEVIDVTLASPGMSGLVGGWRVSNTPSFADHRWICYEIKGTRTEKISVRNPRRARWDEYASETKKHLTSLADITISSVSEVENIVTVVTNKLVKSFETVCPARTVRNNDQPWWNGDFTTIRTTTQAATDELLKAKKKRTGSPTTKNRLPSKRK